MIITHTVGEICCCNELDRKHTAVTWVTCVVFDFFGPLPSSEDSV